MRRKVFLPLSTLDGAHVRRKVFLPLSTLDGAHMRRNTRLLPPAQHQCSHSGVREPGNEASSTSLYPTVASFPALFSPGNEANHTPSYRHGSTSLYHTLCTMCVYMALLGSSYLTPVKTVDLQPLCLAWVTGGGGRAGRGPPGESGRREAAESRESRDMRSLYMRTNWKLYS